MCLLSDAIGDWSPSNARFRLQQLVQQLRVHNVHYNCNKCKISF